MKKIFVTCGDVNGIGPEVAIKAIVKLFNPRRFGFTLIIPENVFDFYLRKLKFNLPVKIIKNVEEIEPRRLNLFTLKKISIRWGQQNAGAGRTAFESIIKAVEFTVADANNSALVTAPISKKSFEYAGIKYLGHTDLLKNYFRVKNIAMIFASGNLMVTPATIHLPLKKIFKYLNVNFLNEFVPFLRKVLITDFNIPKPKIALLGLNPHAGEEGRLGGEETAILNPIVKKFNYLYGTFPPDAFWGMKKQKNFNLTIGLYHDQVLIPFKMLAMNSGVNFTAGLPIVRTSPDHGTASDIAGKLIANELSMVNSIKLAVKILSNRGKNG